jgi:DNA-binding LacI/PurR family transcriptional regulator
MDQVRTMNATLPAAVEFSGNVGYGLSATLNRSPQTTLVMLVQDLSHWYVAELAASAQQVALQHGYQLIPLDFHRSPERERALLETILDSQIAGCIFLWDYDPSNLPLYQQVAAKFTCLQIGDPKPIPRVHGMVGNDYEGGAIAVQHLIDLGYRQIGHVTMTPAIDSVTQRKQAYLDALAKAGLQAKPEWMLDLPYGLSDTARNQRYPLIVNFLSQPKLPRALFVCADWLASEVIECIQELGLRVPDDLALVGYDDAMPYALTSIPLTTVRVDLHEVGKVAVERVLFLLQNPACEVEPARVSIPPTLVVRASSIDVTPTSERWDFVMRYVQDHFREDISVAQIAGKFGFDPNYFSHRFTQVFGKRFTEHVNHLRLQYAAQMLLTTPHTVEHIAESSGFQAVNHFYRQFKRAYAVSPHAFRKQQTFR